jgi:hypothetical protein
MPLSQKTADEISAGIGTVVPFVAAINPLIPMILGIVGAGIKAEPKLEAILKAMFANNNLTPQDFDDAIARIQATTYESLVPHTDLPPS